MLPDIHKEPHQDDEYRYVFHFGGEKVSSRDLVVVEFYRALTPPLRGTWLESLTFQERRWVTSKYLFNLRLRRWQNDKDKEIQILQRLNFVPKEILDKVQPATRLQTSLGPIS